METLTAVDDVKTSRTAAIFAAALIALTLTGCVTGASPKEKAATVTERPALEPPDGLSTDTPEQLLDWTIAHVDEVVTFLGPNNNWKTQEDPPQAWDPTNRKPWGQGSCGAEDHNIGQYNIQVLDVSPVADPDALAEKVRAHWESQGYTVGQLGPTEQDETGNRELTVFLKNNAGLSYSVSTEVQAIQVTSECAKVW